VKKLVSLKIIIGAKTNYFLWISQVHLQTMWKNFDNYFTTIKKNIIVLAWNSFPGNWFLGDTLEMFPLNEAR
jgi:hypothetical protein